MGQTEEKKVSAGWAGWACPLCSSVYSPQVVECARCNASVPPMSVERRAIILWLRGKPEYTVVYYP